MKIFILVFLTVSTLLSASISDINNKIDNNKKQINSVKIKKSTLNKNINRLAKTINSEESEYEKVVSILRSTNTKLLLNKLKLSDSISKVKQLNAKSKKLQIQKESIEKNVVDFVVEKFSMSMGVEQIDKKNINDIVNKELYTLVFENTKSEILNLNIEYLKLNNSIRLNEKNIKKLNAYIKEQNEVKQKYLDLEQIQERKLASLKGKHKSYQKNLEGLITKQNKITDLLGSLNILKKKEIKAEELRIKKAKDAARKKELARQKAEKAKKAKETTVAKKTISKTMQFEKKDSLDKEIDIEVKKIGSSAKGVKISKYYGSTTISPLKSYEITKRFGKYYDAVYKMELFNESVALKTKIPNAKVFSVFKGQVVYAKQNSGLLENVVIVKHANNLHTIYSHLDQISPTLKAGKWIPKGYVVGRVNDTLEFQATKNSKYIDPLKLIKGVK